MAVAQYRVSKSGCLTLPVETRRRWGIAAGGTVEIADLGDAVVVVPTGREGLRSMLSQAQDPRDAVPSMDSDVTPGCHPGIEKPRGLPRGNLQGGRPRCHASRG